MLGLLYKFTTPWAKANRIEIFCNRVLGKAANCLYPIWCSIKKTQKHKWSDDSVIISLTSYPARIDKVHICIESLLRQTIKPKHLILWLAASQFPDGIPKKLNDLTKKGLEIRYCEDFRSYKKIFETAQIYPDYNIVIADDDTLYPPNWLEGLIKTSGQYEKCVVCYRASKIRLDESGIPVNGKYWDSLSADCKGPDYLLSATGVGGVLYPKGFFSGCEIDREKIMSIAPTSDDYWLKVFSVYRGYKVVKVNVNSTEWFTVKNSQRTSLTSVNAGNQGDVMKNLLKLYSVSFEPIAEE